MSEPLVTRNPEIQRGQPCLRGTRFPVSQLQDAMANGGIQLVRRQYSVLDEWSYDDLNRAATYPRLVCRFAVEGMDDEFHVTAYTDGCFHAESWYTPEETPALIAAIQQAANAITAWRDACDEWEASHQ